MTVTLPPTLTVPEYSALVGASTWAVYEQIKSDALPVPVLRIGRAIRIPTQAVANLLGLDVEIEMPERVAAGAATPTTEPTHPAPASSETKEHDRVA